MSLAKWNASWGHRRLTLALCVVVGATCMALLALAGAAQAATWNVTTTADTRSRNLSALFLLTASGDQRCL